MKIWFLRLGMLLAVAFLVLTVLNASWLAPEPKGAVKLIAHRGLHQLSDDDGSGKPCTAGDIEQPAHPYVENTVPSIERAAELGAYYVSVDLVQTKDGRLALFRDAELDCRTNGKGPVADKTLEQLKALDAGYGYSADGGSSYPLRGKGIGAIPSVEEAMAASGRARLLYNMERLDAGGVKRLIGAVESAGRDTGERGDAFYGSPAAVAAIRQKFPDAWAFGAGEAEDCTGAYIALGWSGFVPAACRETTAYVPLTGQWTIWGWPNRMLARMEENGTRTVVVYPRGDGAEIGLDLPEQLGEIPASFNGYVFVEDGFSVIPALIERFDDRNQAEIDAAFDAAGRRRARR